MNDAPDWEQDGRDWPNREASRFMEAGGIRWHVQRLGSGPCLLLLHGTGAATHSWRTFAPLLAEHFTVVAPDLPGHGFTTRPQAGRLTLPGMAEAVRDLLAVLGVAPEVVAGHSAGAAILARMCLDGTIRPRLLLSINGALLPAGGLRGPWLAPLLRVVVGNDAMAHLLARRAADRKAIEALLAGSGSRLDARGIDLYQRLACHAAHVGTVLQMMASWDTRPLERDLPGLTTQLLLLAGEDDAMVPPAEADRVRRQLPSARTLRLPRLGHLAHEEEPARVAEILTAAAQAAGVQVR